MKRSKCDDGSHCTRGRALAGCWPVWLKDCVHVLLEVSAIAHATELVLGHHDASMAALVLQQAAALLCTQASGLSPALISAVGVCQAAGACDCACVCVCICIFFCLCVYVCLRMCTSTRLCLCLCL